MVVALRRHAADARRARGVREPRLEPLPSLDPGDHRRRRRLRRLRRRDRRRRPRGPGELAARVHDLAADRLPLARALGHGQPTAFDAISVVTALFPFDPALRALSGALDASGPSILVAIAHLRCWRSPTACSPGSPAALRLTLRLRPRQRRAARTANFQPGREPDPDANGARRLARRRAPSVLELGGHCGGAVASGVARRSARRFPPRSGRLGRRLLVALFGPSRRRTCRRRSCRSCSCRRWP